MIKRPPLRLCLLGSGGFGVGGLEVHHATMIEHRRKFRRR